jgi:hypothetical protein
MEIGGHDSRASSQRVTTAENGQKILNVFRLLRRNVDSDLAHHLKRQRVDGDGSETGAQAFIAIVSHRPQEPFRHLAANGIVSAKKQDTGLRHIPDASKKMLRQS